MRALPVSPGLSVVSLCFVLILVQGSTVRAQTWTFSGVVAVGEQMDAVAGPAGRIHLVSSRYYQLDSNGTVLVDEAHGDPLQGSLFFPPALAVSPDGTVHVVTRDSGDYTTGYAHGYHRRAPAGTWAAGYTYNTPTRWNFLVGVAADGLGHVHLMSGHPGTDVWADLQIYQEDGGSASYLGAVTGVYRADFDARIRGRGGRVYLATGNYIPGSTAMFSHGDGGAGLVGQLQANLQHLAAGTGSEKGFPDLAIDGQGTVHLTYGSGHTDHNQFPASTAGCVPGEVHYNQFAADGTKLLATDATLFTGLGVWHISIGLSAVAASDDGQAVVVVALRTPDQKEGLNSELLWVASTDGGQTWSAPQSLGVNTNAGEGRQRPRLVALGSRFFLFYRDASTPGISLATITYPAAAPAAPSDLTATAASPSRIDVCWQDHADDEDGFTVERDSGGGFPEITTVSANSTCHGDEGLAPGSTHRYRVRAYRGSVSSAPSNEASATTPELPQGDAGLPTDGGSVDGGPVDGGPLDGGSVGDASVLADGGDGPGDPIVGSGCSCRSVGTPAPVLLLWLLPCWLVWRRRR